MAAMWSPSQKASGTMRIIIRILVDMSHATANHSANANHSATGQDEATGHQAVAITRVINPCALIEVDGDTVLTDPYFVNHWFFPMHEAIGMTPNELPRLAAILGGHGVFDHWQPRSMVTYAHHATTPAFVATRQMATKARRAGFVEVEVLQWGEQRVLSSRLTVTALPGERMAHLRTNNYLLTTTSTSVLIATEARTLKTIGAIAAEHRVDVAVLPIDGLSVFGRRLVMNASLALEAAHLLGAHTLVPIHYSQRAIRPVLQCSSGIDELRQLAHNYPNVTILAGATGRRIEV
jgi:L-ascorbate metabolism protein UlaG (beta-lactamase superfamily)